MKLTQKRNRNGNWVCADCRCETMHGYQSGSVVICGDCKFDGTSPAVGDAAADDPRRGQAAGINAMRRRVE